MRTANTVLVVDENDRLIERKVRVARKLRDEVILESGLEAGDRVLWQLKAPE